jgi:hypothetical protein
LFRIAAPVVLSGPGNRISLAALRGFAETRDSDGGPSCRPFPVVCFVPTESRVQCVSLNAISANCDPRPSSRPRAAIRNTVAHREAGE